MIGRLKSRVLLKLMLDIQKLDGILEGCGSQPRWMFSRPKKKMQGDQGVSNMVSVTRL